MLLFIDGFDHYATADTAKKWGSTGGTPSISPSLGRRGGGALAQSVQGYLIKNITAGASFIVGFAFKMDAFTAGPTQAVQFMDSGTGQVDLRVNADGTLSVTRNGTALTGGTSSNSMSSGAFYYIEFKLTIADSIAANSCKVRVNNVDWITVATGQDTKNTANASANQVRFGNISNPGATFTYDDFYLCDSSGSTNNDFLGDVRIDTLFPNADGNYSQFTPSTGTSHFSLVDETTPNTSDYNDGSTVGDRDSYALQNLASLASQTVYGIQVNAAVVKDDAGAKSAAPFIRSGSTNSDGTSVALSTSQSYASQIFETDPNGSIAWTETSVNAMEAGVKVTA